jgi:hypothetical protein
MITQFHPTDMENLGRIVGKMLSSDAQDQEAQLAGLARGMKETTEAPLGMTVTYLICQDMVFDPPIGGKKNEKEIPPFPSNGEDDTKAEPPL